MTVKNLNTMYKIYCRARKDSIMPFITAEDAEGRGKKRALSLSSAFSAFSAVYME
jgi:hypothetical protein